MSGLRLDGRVAAVTGAGGDAAPAGEVVKQIDARYKSHLRPAQ